MDVARLLIAFPIGHNELRVVFSDPVDPDSAQRASSYATESGLKILAAYVDPGDHCRVTLRTEAMDGEAMRIDVLRVKDMRTSAGSALSTSESPRFIHGIASIPAIQKPTTEKFPFPSRFEGLVATASCQKDGGVDSNILIDSLGYSFLHRELGGPFNSIKVVVGVGKKHVPGIEDTVNFRNMALKLGAKAALAKPVNRAHLVRLMREILRADPLSGQAAQA